MTFREAMAEYKRVRRSTPVSVRLQPWAKTTYRCACGTRLSVVLCCGVGGDPTDMDVAAPDRLPCPGCGEETLDRGGSRTLLDYRHDDVSRLPYLRVPSRRASIVLAKRGLACGQLVYPEDPLA